MRMGHCEVKFGGFLQLLSSFSPPKHSQSQASNNKLVSLTRGGDDILKVYVPSIGGQQFGPSVKLGEVLLRVLAIDLHRANYIAYPKPGGLNGRDHNLTVPSAILPCVEIWALWQKTKAVGRDPASLIRSNCIKPGSQLVVNRRTIDRTLHS
ncbi:hypothetical protein PGTUg99_001843 [Puccinia graminis f. sp. tritici]|uniref:Uncharacterized protein n=1 Tax=Puccinia graminis f. sp. tritici TaxID=56615 RepID=A0A5B0PPY0_PUCGR|nr:hypothetical protein PGTUg99_001843 [Puccinia graminis f. sp. tritici]